MTKPQIWVAAFLLLFIVLFMLGRLTKKEEPMKDFSGMGSQMGEQTTTELTGDKLIQSFGCINCHGADLAGTNMAPSLKGLKELWSSRDNLINYLRNPNSFMDSDRFKAYRAKYPNGIMPSYGNKDVKDLGKIADYLLTQ
ncbi:MAG TPA: cytochrome c [Ignavibacteriaceae bacterium]|nr:cytochrome c [Ignavibacteriaceae bacterium]